MQAQTYSHSHFNEMCEDIDVNDSNVDTFIDTAFISICCTDECRQYYLEDKTGHYFKQNHNNVLNIEFDDLTEDKEWNGYQFKALTEEQAKQIVDFIDLNNSKKFYIHCTAGISRSGAVATFIRDFYLTKEEQKVFDLNNPHIRPNNHVLTLLKRVYYKKNNMFTK